MNRSALLALALALACATTKPDGPRREVSALINARTGIDQALRIEQDRDAQARVRERVAKLLRRELTVDDALRIAMVNNPELQATLEDLGIAQADLVQAGLLENPVLAGDLVNSTLGNGLGGGLSLSTSLLSAFLIPAKRRLAKAQLRHAVVSVAHAALELTRDVRVAYAEMQAAEAGLDLQRTLVQVAEVADELAEAQAQAGNLPALDRQRFAAALDEARMSFTDTTIEVVEAREQLNRLLGLWGDQTDWVATPVGPLPTQTPRLDDLERRGIADRLDVSAARAERDAMLLALKLRRRGVIPQVEVGVEARNEVGNDPGHEWVIGPSLAIEIPIFDPGHADFARLRALLRQSEHHLTQVAIDARSEIRVERERLVAAARKVEYLEGTMIPRQQELYARALEQYNGMLIGAYELLQTRATQVDVQRQRIEALRDYRIAWAQLELAVGGRLETRSPPAKPSGSDHSPLPD